MSGDLINTTDGKVDIRWDGPSGPILVECKRTNSMRDVRDALIALAYRLRGASPPARAVCVFVDSRLSSGRLKKELLQLRSVLHPEIADRIHFLVENGARSRNVVPFTGSLENVPPDFYTWLQPLVESERLRGHTPQPSPRQSVIAALAHLRLWNEPPVTIKQLQDECGVSYPTVAIVLKELASKGWLEDSGERGVRLRPLTSGEWIELARDHARQRKVLLFTDPTGHSSPEQLDKRLAHLQSTGKLPRSVRIGGVLGASRHFPELDITAAPRLDLSVDADPAHVASMLDAALQPRTSAAQRVALAVHVTRDPWVITHAGSTTHGSRAGELECLADLIEMGFIREASEMAHHMELTSKEGRPLA